MPLPELKFEACIVRVNISRKEEDTPFIGAAGRAWGNGSTVELLTSDPGATGVLQPEPVGSDREGLPKQCLTLAQKLAQLDELKGGKDLKLPGPKSERERPYRTPSLLTYEIVAKGKFEDMKAEFKKITGKAHSALAANTPPPPPASTAQGAQT